MHPQRARPPRRFAAAQAMVGTAASNVMPDALTIRGAGEDPTVDDAAAPTVEIDPGAQTGLPTGRPDLSPEGPVRRMQHVLADSTRFVATVANGRRSAAKSASFSVDQ